MDETVSDARDRFDECPAIAIGVERTPQKVDGLRKVRLFDHAIAPQLIVELFSRQDAAAAFQKDRKQIERLAVQDDRLAVTKQLPRFPPEGIPAEGHFAAIEIGLKS